MLFHVIEQDIRCARLAQAGITISFAVSPCVSALRLLRALPSAVRGPLPLSAFERFASICFIDAI
jgi:hypothetical protein